MRRKGRPKKQKAGKSKRDDWSKLMCVLERRLGSYFPVFKGNKGGFKEEAMASGENLTVWVECQDIIEGERCFFE